MLEGKSHPKIRFGVFEYNPRARELSKHGSRLKLQEQPLQVLTALLERAGEIVEREELQRRLWPDGTFVDFEQSLNKAINKLREALGDSAEKPIYVETIARRGYRFVAPVAIEEPKQAGPGAVAEATPEATKQAPVPEKRVVRSHARLWWGVGLAAAAILAMGLWPVPEPKVRITALTSDGRGKSNYLVIAGGRVIYGAGGLTPGERAGIWSVPTTGGEPRREPSPCSEEKHTFLGQASYVRRRMMLTCASEGSISQDWLADFDGGNPKWIGSFYRPNSQRSISPDLKTLLIDRKEGLFIKPVDGGPEKLLAKPSEGEIIEYNYWHPSGKKFGFFLKVNDVWKMFEMNADGTGMRPMLPGFPGPQYGGYWSPDGRRLYFLSYREGLPNNDVYLLAGRGWLGWMRSPVPERLTSGPVIFGLPNEDPDNPLVVYLRGGSSQAAAMKLNLETNAWEPFLGGIPADCAAFSPDGQWIAYVSWPGAQLWKCRRDGSGKVLLDDGLAAYGPRWAPDGSRIAYSGRPFSMTTEVEAATPFRIYTITANGGKREPVPGAEGPGFDPGWSPDGKRIAFAPNMLADTASKEQRHVSIVNLETGVLEAVPGSDNIWSVVWSPDGRWLAGIAQNGPAKKPVVYNFATRQWTELAERVMGPFRWSRDSRSVFGLRYGPTVEIVRIEIATRKMERVRAITEFELTGVLGDEGTLGAGVPRAGVPGAGVFWTPEQEPIVLKKLSSTQIYRIERDR